MPSQWYLQGKTCLITGATQGIGRETARGLAKLGANLVLVARDARRGAEIVSEIQQSAPAARIELLIGDLSIQAEIHRIADEFLAHHDRLHVLINNAGALFNTRGLTRDGYEQTFALNHLAYFLLTDRLLPMLKATARAPDNSMQEARIINVASRAHKRVPGLRFDDLMAERHLYIGLKAYSQSKLANVLYTFELARRLQGSGVTVNCLHPGVVRSGYGHNNGLLFRIGLFLYRPMMITSEAGARTPIYLASSPEVSGVTGKYFDKCRPIASSRASMDEAAARKLFEVSEKLVHATQVTGS